MGGNGNKRRALRGVLVVLMFALLAAQVSQEPQDLSRMRSPDRMPAWRSEISLVAANALLGGITAGIAQSFRHRSFRKGFVAGAAGGTVAYAGRRVSVLDFKGAGFLGREVGAVGASMVRNAGSGRAAFSRIMLPLGPARIYIDRTVADNASVHLKLNAYELYWLARAIRDSELEFKADASLSAGAPVFQKTEGRLTVAGEDLNGYQVGGTILLSREAGPGQHWTFAHERVHVLQSDFIAHVWMEPVERWAMRSTRPTRILYGVFDVGMLDPLLRTGMARGLGFRSGNAPQEFEAEYLEDR